MRDKERYDIIIAGVLIILASFVYSGMHRAKALDVEGGDGILIYGDTGNGGPRMRTYASTTGLMSAESAAVASTSVASSSIRFVTSPTKQEALLAWQNGSGVLSVYCYDGTSWVLGLSTSSSATLVQRRWFDVAYEKATGDALVVFSHNVSGNKDVGYITKSGTTDCTASNWSVPAYVDLANQSGIIQWVIMSSDPNATSSIAAIFADASKRLTAKIWNGTQWLNEPATFLETNLEVVAAGQDVQSFDVAYEATSSNLLVGWGNLAGASATNGARYATKGGGQVTGTWTVATTSWGADDATAVNLTANPYTNEIIYSSIGGGGDDLQAARWDGQTFVSTSANLDISCTLDTVLYHPTVAIWASPQETNFPYGSSRRAAVVYGNNGVTTLDHRIHTPPNTWDTATTPATQEVLSPPTGSNQRWFASWQDPFHSNMSAVAIADSLADLHFKIASSSGGTFFWNDTEESATVHENSLPNPTLWPADFGFWNFIPYATTTQAAYQWFFNKDSAAVNGTTTWFQDQGYTATSSGAQFRLRMLVDIGSNQSTSTSRAYSLQYATRSGTCDTAFTGESYATVTPSTPIAFYDNASVNDGVSLTANTNDPTYQSQTATNQTYEESNNATTSTTIPSANVGKWDFSLYDNAAPAGTTYCLRLIDVGYVGQGPVTLGTYAVIPQITTYQAPVISMEYNSVFDYGGLATPTPKITVTDVAGGLLASSTGLRIAIATSSVNMLWDTSDTQAVLGGSASTTIATSSRVQYEGGGSVLYIPLTSNFGTGDNLTISGLSFKSFNTATSATYAAFGLFTGGPLDQVMEATTTTTTVAIRGTVTAANHSLGQITDRWDTLTSTSTTHFRFRLNANGENIMMSTTTFSITGVSGVSATDITGARLYVDRDGNGFVSSGDALATSSILTLPNANGTYNEMSIFSCVSRADCVDDYITDEDTSFLYVSGAAGERNQTQTLGFADTSNRNERISKVSVLTRARNSSGADAPGTFRNVLVVSGTVYKGAATNTPIVAGYTNYTDAWTTNPATGATWSWSDINSLEFGFYGSIAAGQTGQAMQFTQSYIVVDHEIATGSVSISGTSGSITFATSTPWTLYQTATDYLITFSADNLAAADTITLGYPFASTTAVGTTSLQQIASSTGGVTTITHTRDADPVISISGTVYTDEYQTVTVGTGRSIALSVNGGATTTVTTNASGVFTFNSITANSGDAVLLYIENDATYKGTLVTISAGSNISGLAMYTDKVVLDHETAGPMTDTVMRTAYGQASRNVGYATTTNSIIFNHGTTAWVVHAKTYTPGEDISVDDLVATGSAMFAPSTNLVTVRGSWRFSSSASLSQSAPGGILFATTSAPGKIIDTGDNTFASTTINGPGTTWTLATSSLTVSGTTTIAAGTLNTNVATTKAITTNNLVINGGTLVANGSTITINGSAGSTLFTLGSGTFTSGTSTVIMQPDADVNLTSGTFTGSNSFYDLTLSPDLTADRTYTFGSGNASTTRNFTIRPSPFALTKLLTVNMGADLTVGATTTITRTSTATSKLVILPVATSYNLTTGNLDIQTGGTFDGTSANSDLTLNGPAGSTLLTLNGGSFTASNMATKFKTDGSVTLTSGTFSGANSFGSITINPTITADRTYTFGPGDLTVTLFMSIAPTAATALRLTVNLGGNTTVGLSTTLQSGSNALSTLNTTGSNYSFTTGILTIASSGTLSANGSTITITSSSGVLITRSGTFTAASSTVVMNPDADATLTSGTFTGSNAFNNLTLSPTLTAPRIYAFGSSAASTTGAFTINPTAASTNKGLTVLMSGTLDVATTSTTTIKATSFATSSLVSNGQNALWSGHIDVQSGGELTSTSTIKLTGTATSSTLFTLASSNATTTLTSSTLELGVDASLTLLNGPFYGSNALNTVNITPTLTSARTQILNVGNASTSAFTINPTAGSTNKGLSILMNSPLDVTGGAGVLSILSTSLATSSLSTNGQNPLFTSLRISVSTGGELIASSTIYLGNVTVGCGGLCTASLIRSSNATTTLTGSTIIYNKRTGDNSTTDLFSSGIFTGVNALNSLQINPVLAIGLNRLVLNTGAIEFNGYLNTNPTAFSTAKGLAIFLGASTTVASTATTTVRGGSNATTTLTTNGSANNFSTGHLEVQAGGEFIASSTVTVAQNWLSTSTNATTTLTGSTVIFNTTATSTITGTTTFNIFQATTPGKALVFHRDAGASPVYTFSTFTVTGSAGNYVDIKSDLAGSQWKAHFNSAQSGSTYARVKDSGCDTGTSNITLDSANSVDVGNNDTCWVFPVSVSGTVYIAEDQSTNIGTGHTVSLSVNGAATTSAQTTAGGAFSITTSYTTNDVITIFIENDPTYTGTLVTQAASASAISGLSMYTNKVVLRHETAGPMTDTLLRTGKGLNTRYINYATSTNSITFDHGTTAWIESAKTYTPGEDISVDDLVATGTATFVPSTNLVTVRGSWRFPSTGSTLTQSAPGGILFATTSAPSTKWIDSGGETFASTTINGSGTTWTLATSTMTVSGTTTIAAGTLNTNASTNIALTTGTLNIAGGTLTANGSTINLVGENPGNVLFTKSASGTFTAGTSNLVASSTQNVKVLSGTFTSANSLYDFTISSTIMAARTITLNDGNASTTHNFTISPYATSSRLLTVNMGADLTVGATTTITKTGSATSKLVLKPASTSYNLTSGNINIGSICTLDGSSATSAITLNGPAGSTLWTRSITGNFYAGNTSVYMVPDANVTLISAAELFENLYITPTIAANRTYRAGASLQSSLATIQPAGVGNTLTVELSTGSQQFSSCCSGLTVGGGTASAVLNINSDAGNPVYLSMLALNTNGTINAKGSSIIFDNSSAVSNILFDLNGGSFNAGTSTVSFALDADPLQLLGTSNFTGSNAFYNLTMNPDLNGGRTYYLGPVIASTTGNFTIQPNPFDTSSLTVNLGAWLDVATTSTTTIQTTDPATALLVTNGQHNFNTGHLDIGLNGKFVASSTVTVAQNWLLSHSTATTTLTGSTVIFNTTATSTITGTTTFATFQATTPGKALVFHRDVGASPVYTFSTFTVTGSAGNYVDIKSDLAGSQWLAHFNSAQSGSTYARVKDSGCDTGTSNINLTSSVNVGNNDTCWVFQTASDISGNVYIAEDQSTNIGSGHTISLSVNGGATTSVSTTAGGAFSFSSVGVSANDTLTLFIENDPTYTGTLVTQTDATNISSLAMYTGKTTLHHQTAGPMTDTLLRTAKSLATPYILYATSTNSITFATGTALWIDTAKTYTPGETVFIKDQIIATGTASFVPNANQVWVGGDWRFATTSTFTTTGTTTFATTSATKFISSGCPTCNFYNLVFDGVGAVWTLTGHATTSNNLTISNGIFDLNGKNLKATGANYYNNDTFRLQGAEVVTGLTQDTDSGTTTYNGTGTYSSGLKLGATYYNLAISGTGTYTTTATTTVNNNLLQTAGNLKTAQSSAAGITVTNIYTIGANATTTIQRSHTTGNGAGQTITAGYLNVNAKGAIDADGGGFGAGSGPGSPGSEGGGTHGGVGSTNVATYGSSTNPTSLGSGGGSNGCGAGGGAVIISSAGTVTVNGIVTANGTSCGSRFGSGGSVNITAGTLAGAGVIRANAPDSGSNAGGGRVGLGGVTTNTFTGALEAKSTMTASGGGYKGYAGTIYLDSAHRSSLTLGGGGNMSSLRLGSDDSYSYTFGNITVQSGGTLEIDGNPNINNGLGSAAVLNVSTLDVQNGGTMSADAMGFGVNRGPGAPSAAEGHGSHGGIGASNSVGRPYGSVTNPRELGSGAGNNGCGGGGGAIIISATGAVTVDGTMSADGTNLCSRSSSGGTINISADSISGSGTIRANGGSAGAGGGRVAIALTSGTTFSPTIQSLGGGSGGAAGTVYLQSAIDGANGGQLVVNNAGVTTAAGVDTLITATTTGTTTGTLRLLRSAKFTVDNGVSFTIGGSSGTTTIYGNGSTIFNNYGTTTVAGTTTYSGLGAWNNFGTSSVVYTGATDDSAVTIATTTYAHLLFNNAGTVFSAAATTSATTSVNIMNGTFDIGSFGLTMTGNPTNATFFNNDTLRLVGSQVFTNFTNDTDSGTTTYNGGTTYTGLKAGNAYYNLAFEGAGTYTLNSQVNASSSITLTSGTLDVSTSDYNVVLDGSWLRTAGTFTARNGTTTFTGTATSTISGTTTFSHFYAPSPNKALVFHRESAVSPVYTFSYFTVTGTAGNYVDIKSDLAGSQWKAHFNSLQTGSTYARVKDSGCDAGTSNIQLTDGSSVNVSNNDTCWVFVSNTAPSISSVDFNAGGNAINLIESTYKWATTSMTVTDAEGCSTIASVSAKAYLASTTNTGTSCSSSDKTCYTAIACTATTTGNTCTGGADTSAQYDCGFKLWYITTPSDTGDWASSIWSVSATTSDTSYATSTATNTGQTVDVNTLSALDVTPTLSYGTLVPGADTGVFNSTTTVTNTGNTTITPRLSGTAMSSVDDTILVGQQQYSTAPFAYGVGTALSGTPTSLGATVTASTATTSPSTRDIPWGLGVPSGKRSGSYTGSNTIEI